MTTPRTDAAMYSASLVDVSRNLETELQAARSRVRELEDTLSHLFHYTDCTTGQMELIEKVLPQKVEDWVCPTCNTKNPSRYLNCDNACCQE